MESEIIRNSIEKEEIQLNILEKLIHYRLSILTFIIATFCCLSSYNNLMNFKSNLLEANFKIGLFLLVICLISFAFQKKKLKLKLWKLSDNKINVFENVIEIAKMKNWEIEFKNEKALILKTYRPFSSSRYFISKSFGEKIFIFKKHNNILFKSIYDLNRSSSFVVSNGENNENEMYIMNIIKPTANTRF